MAASRGNGDRRGAVALLDDVSVWRGGREVLAHIDARIEPGDIIGLIGRNGSGKTTLLETLLGFHRPASGQVQLWDCPVARLDGARKRRIGFVPQRDELVEGLTGDQQLALIASFYPGWDHALAERLVAGWELPLSRPARHMSMGQRQRLSIVLALAPRPDLLVLDEPVASLDPLARAQFLAEMAAVAAEAERALVLSSHIVRDLEALVNRVWVLEAGRMRWQGPVQRLAEAVGAGPGEAVDLERAFRHLVA